MFFHYYIFNRVYIGLIGCYLGIMEKGSHYLGLRVCH